VIRTYSELVRLPTFLERFHYLKLHGVVGDSTFGFDRYLNQRFYHSSREWKLARDYVIARDNACDLGVEGFEICGRVIVHHMNPISISDLIEAGEQLVDPEFLICVSHQTHNAITYGDENLLPKELVIRLPNDTCPWIK